MEINRYVDRWVVVSRINLIRRKKNTARTKTTEESEFSSAVIVMVGVVFRLH